MYLEHFGLTEPPFRITPVTVFFFSGANRGEILDALIYSISEVEGIIKVSGEVGSGKTMLCRMLLEKLPKHIETIYLANPSLSREEMLYAIADGLGLSTSGERVGVIMSMIQNKLEEKAREGKRIVVLVDEAHAMPLDTLEELRLLYNLQVGNSKLLQIVLFGQPELNTKLDQPNMRQLKDRIVHHFNMQPLSRNILESYLMFRMRAAGYHGPNIFSPAAIKLIADTSNGLMRRVNILADKSLLAAFVEDTHDIGVRHVQAAMRDSDISPPSSLAGKKLLVWGTVAVLVAAGMAAWWRLEQGTEIITSDHPVAAGKVNQMASGSISNSPKEQAMDITASSVPPLTAESSPAAIAAAPKKPAPLPSKPEAETVAIPTTGGKKSVSSVANTLPAASPPVQASNIGTKASVSSLFDQRMAAGSQLLDRSAAAGAGQKKPAASIQLFYKAEFKKKSIEGFLRRADKLGVLSQIYLIPEKSDNKDGLRILYGAYPSVNAARNAVKDMPARYQEAFATSIYIFP